MGSGTLPQKFRIRLQRVARLDQGAEESHPEVISGCGERGANRIAERHRSRPREGGRLAASGTAIQRALGGGCVHDSLAGRADGSGGGVPLRTDPESPRTAASPRERDDRSVAIPAETRAGRISPSRLVESHNHLRSDQGLRSISMERLRFRGSRRVRTRSPGRR